AFSKTIAEEGIVIDNFKIISRGRFREQATLKLLTHGPYPSRNPQQNIGDLKAQIAANETGVQVLKKMIEQFSLPVVHAYMRHVRKNASHTVKQLLNKLKSGRFTYPMDDGNHVTVTIRINQKKQTAQIDFTGTSKQS